MHRNRSRHLSCIIFRKSLHEANRLGDSSLTLELQLFNYTAEHSE